MGAAVRDELLCPPRAAPWLMRGRAGEVEMKTLAMSSSEESACLLLGGCVVCGLECSASPLGLGDEEGGWIAGCEPELFGTEFGLGGFMVGAELCPTSKSSSYSSELKRLAVLESSPA